MTNVVFKNKNTNMCVLMFTGWLMRLLTTSYNLSDQQYVIVRCKMHANQSFTREKIIQFRQKSLNERRMVQSRRYFIAR